MASSLELAARDHGLDLSRLVTAVDGTTLPRWNAAARARATAVVHCSSTADVRAAVRIARDRDLAVSVFSGGNGWAGSSVRDGALVVDVSAMDAIAVDTGTRTVRIGGGVRSDVLTRETEAQGLTPVGPTVGRVHVLGFTLGGGYGPLNGRFGLACDNLVAAEIVTAAGDVLTVDGDSEPVDARWADRVHASLAPDAMPGGYVNLLAADDHEAVQHAYGPNADRLLAIKRRVDPAGVLTGTPLPHPAG